jgi:ABC-type multidrug transport system fused ATPase/permease subunit
MLWRGSLSGLGYNTLIVLGPILLGRALDSVLALEQEGFAGPAIARLQMNLVLLVVATAAFQGLRSVKRWDFRRMSNRIGTDLQLDLLRATIGWPMDKLERERIGDLMSRAVGDVQVVVETIMTTITEVYDTLVLMIAYFAVLLYYSPWLTLLCSLPAPLTAVCSHYAGRWVFRRASEARVVASKINTHLQEQLNAVRVLRFFGREADERARLEVLCREQLQANLAATLLQSGLMPVYAGVSALGLVAVIGAGGGRVIAGSWTIGSFTAYLTMFLAMTTRTLMAARVLNRLHAGRAAWVRVLAKLGEPGRPRAGEGRPRPGQDARALGVDISNLRFAYPGSRTPVLEDVTLSIRPGSLVCVTGPVGSGKSALAAVLTGLYPYRGSILLGDRELRAIEPAELPSLVSYLGQEPFLFSDSIRGNVTFGGGDAGDPTFVSAVSGAALAADLESFAEGWDTPVGERGVQVSGGQKQRISLARALYARPGLLVLDDPFSAVDITTERRMVAGLRKAAADSTIVVFSHRLGAFASADMVVVLDAGRVQACGTHDELLAAGGTYARVYRAQAWLEEQRA